MSSTVDKIDQSLYMLNKAYKPQLLVHLLQDPAWSKVLVFTRTKHGANKVTCMSLRTFSSLQSLSRSSLANLSFRCLLLSMSLFVCSGGCVVGEARCECYANPRQQESECTCGRYGGLP